MNGRTSTAIGHTEIYDVRVMLNDVTISHLSIFRIFWKPFSCFSNIKCSTLWLASKRIHYLSEDGIENLSLVITVSHHSVSLVMPIGDPRDRFIYPTRTLMMDSYILGITVCHHLASLMMPISNP